MSIEELTAAQLRVAIAKAKGYSKLHPYIHDPRFPSAIGGLEGYKPNGEFTIRVPDWPESIADAWELVEEMRAGIVDMHYHRDTLWRCATVHGDDCMFIGRGETAPLAICRAWLALAWSKAK